MSAKRYRTIVADPPWKVERVIRSGGRRSRGTVVPYEFMGLDAIKALPVAEMADDDCALFLWSTRELFREGAAAEVARAWGFEPRGEIIWGLRNTGMGTDSIANDHEPCLVAVRGSIDFAADRPMGVHFWRQRYSGKWGKDHSAKPEGFVDFVERITPEPRVELFARRARLAGWDYWGDESLGTAEMPAA